MTNRQAQLLRDIAEGVIDFYIAGSDVIVARKLDAAGLLKLEDNGPMIIGGRSDNERWSVEITTAGRATYAALVELGERAS